MSTSRDGDGALIDSATGLPILDTDDPQSIEAASKRVARSHEQIARGECVTIEFKDACPHPSGHAWSEPHDGFRECLWCARRWYAGRHQVHTEATAQRTGEPAGEPSGSATVSGEHTAPEVVPQQTATGVSVASDPQVPGSAEAQQRSESVGALSRSPYEAESSATPGEPQSPGTSFKEPLPSLSDLATALTGPVVDCGACNTGIGFVQGSNIWHIATSGWGNGPFICRRMVFDAVMLLWSAVESEFGTNSMEMLIHMHRLSLDDGRVVLEPRPAAEGGERE